MITIEQQYMDGGIRLFTLSNECGMTLELSNLGAGIISCVVPDSAGTLADVALGYANPLDYLHDGPCMGKTPGRYANRIARGRFSIDGAEYYLRVNNGPNALHGGPDGFQNRIWQVEILPNGVRFSYVSGDFEELYPGRLTVSVEYTIEEKRNRINIDYRAFTTAPTVVNLTNHTYWNLRGENAGSVLSHLLSMKCRNYLPTDDTLIPTGSIDPVKDTPMDFTSPKEIGKDIEHDFPALRFAKGYDSSWVVDDWTPGKFTENVVTLHDPVSGRTLEIGSTQPAAHIYTGNWLSGSPLSKSGRSYADYDGVAIEMQGFPDAPNHPGFPSQLLRPNEEYHHIITFTFR